MNVVLIGEEAAGMRTLQSLEQCGVRVVAVMASPRRQDGVVSLWDLATEREYIGREVPENGNLCWNRPARRIVDFIRASNFFPFPSPWGVPRTKRGDSTLGIPKARLTGTPVDAPPGTVGTERSGGVEVACADEWILVRQVFREGICIPPRDALKAGDRLADCVSTPASKP